MADCEYLKACPFFNDKMAARPAISEVYKSKYCRGDKTLCARYQVRTKKGPGTVPGNLFPNEIERAQGLLATA